MYTLYHLPFSGDCRIVRIALSEKKIEVKLQVEPVWERRNSFLAKNPEGTVPVLLINDINILCGTSVIVEWLEESIKHPNLLGEDPFQRAESRRLMNWFSKKYYKEVEENIVFEKIFKGFIGKGQPNSNILRIGRKNLKTHIEYINWLSKQRDWLGGKTFSIADIASAIELGNLCSIDVFVSLPIKDFLEAPIIIFEFIQ